MSKVITAINLVDEAAAVIVGEIILYDDGTRYDQAMTPSQIAEALLQIDPDDLADVLWALGLART
jgi:hypothetical protein